MKQINYIVSILLSLLLFSCESNEKEENLTPTTVYFIHSDVQEIKMYRTDSKELYSYSLDLYKAGALKQGADVKLAIMSQAELDAYNTAHNVNYKLLDPSIYKMESMSTSFSDEVSDVNRFVKITFDPFKMDVSDVNSVLPVKIESASVQIGSQSVCLIHPRVYEPVVSLGDKVEQRATTPGETGVYDLSIPVSVLNIDQNAEDVTVETEVDASYVEAYNKEHGTNFKLLPKDTYSLDPQQVIQKGSTQAAFKLRVQQRNLTADNMNSYMLPVKIKSTTSYSIDEGKYYILKIYVMPGLEYDRSTWKVVDFNTQEDGGEGPVNGRATCLIDGNPDTFWHSQWSGISTMPPTPHWIIFDMRAPRTITQIRLYGRKGFFNTREVEFFVSDKPDVDGSWTKICHYNMIETNDEQTAAVETVATGRYLKFVVTHNEPNPWPAGSNAVSSMGEIIPYGY